MTWHLWIFLFFGLVAGVLIWLMTAPLIVIIDSKKYLFCLKWGKLIIAQFLQSGHIQFSIMGWTKVIDPWEQGKSKSRLRKPEIKSSDTSKKKFSIQVSARKISRVLRTFHVQRFELSIDTDNYVLNAYLYPLFQLLSNSNRRLQINFTGDIYLRAIIKNRLYRIVTAFIRS